MLGLSPEMNVLGKFEKNQFVYLFFSTVPAGKENTLTPVIPVRIVAIT